MTLHGDNETLRERVKTEILRKMDEIADISLEGHLHGVVVITVSDRLAVEVWHAGINLLEAIGTLDVAQALVKSNTRLVPMQGDK